MQIVTIKLMNIMNIIAFLSAILKSKNLAATIGISLETRSAMWAYFIHYGLP